MTEPFAQNSSGRRIQFSADGRHLLTASSQMIRMWENPEPPPVAPSWFCDFIEALAGRRLNTQGELEPVSHEKIESLQSRLSSSAESDFYSRWTRWFLLERSQEPTLAFMP